MAQLFCNPLSEKINSMPKSYPDWSKNLVYAFKPEVFRIKHLKFHLPIPVITQIDDELKLLFESPKQLQI
jgi:hypothetical protein